MVLTVLTPDFGGSAGHSKESKAKPKTKSVPKASGRSYEKLPPPAPRVAAPTKASRPAPLLPRPVVRPSAPAPRATGGGGGVAGMGLFRPPMQTSSPSNEEDYWSKRTPSPRGPSIGEQFGGFVDWFRSWANPNNVTWGDITEDLAELKKKEDEGRAERRATMEARREENAQLYEERTGTRWEDDYRNPASPNYGKNPRYSLPEPGFSYTPVRIMPGIGRNRIPLLSRAPEEPEPERNESNPDLDSYLAASLRNATLGQQRELTDEAFYALTPQQQSAVLFNTGLLDAASGDRDNRQGSNTRLFLKDLGLSDLSDEDLNEYLSLQRAVPDSRLGDLENEAARHTAAAASRTIEGPSSSPSAVQMQKDQEVARIAASILADLMAAQGTDTLIKNDRQPAPLGYGSTPNDTAIQTIWSVVADSTIPMTSKDIDDDIRMLRESGYNITRQDFDTFADFQLRSSDFATFTRDKNPLKVPEFNTQGHLFSPRSSDEIRAILGG